MDTQEEIVRLLVSELRARFESQADAIRELDRAGFGPSRIAELLGTTPGTVNVTLTKGRAARKGARKVASDG